MNVNNLYAEVLITYFGIELEEFNKTISLLLATLPPPNKTNIRKQDWLSFVYEQSGIGGDDLQQLLLVNLTYPTAYFKAKHLFYDQPISDHSLDQLIDQLALGDGNGAVYLEFNPWDGYLSTIPVDQTAFPYRSSKFGIQFMMYWNNGQYEKQQMNWLNQIYLSIYNDSTKHAYINYIDRDVQDWMNVYYHPHQQRLINIQHIYDKNNRFYFEKSIVSGGISSTSDTSIVFLFLALFTCSPFFSVPFFCSYI